MIDPKMARYSSVGCSWPTQVSRRKAVASPAPSRTAIWALTSNSEILPEEEVGKPGGRTAVRGGYGQRGSSGGNLQGGRRVGAGAIIRGLPDGMGL